MARTSTWKQHERATARRLGGKRNGNRGAAAADVETDWCVAECKHRETLPQWLHKAMAQAVDAALPGQLPLVVLHQKGQRHGNDFVMLRMRDFEDYFGGFNAGLEADGDGDRAGVPGVSVLREPGDHAD